MPINSPSNKNQESKNHLYEMIRRKTLKTLVELTNDPSHSPLPPHINQKLNSDFKSELSAFDERLRNRISIPVTPPPSQLPQGQLGHFNPPQTLQHQHPNLQPPTIDPATNNDVQNSRPPVLGLR